MCDFLWYSCSCLLSILSLNVGSLIATQRRVELQHILNDSNPDVVFLQETHLSSYHKINLERYIIYRNDNEQGTAVAIRAHFPTKRIFIPNLNVPHVCVQFEKQQNRIAKIFLLVSIYLPSGLSRVNLTTNLNTLASFSEQFAGAIIGGDLNAKYIAWGDQNTNSNGKSLFDWMIDSSYPIMRLCSTNPSYPNGNSFLDHFLVSAHLINIFTVNFEITTKASFSDHLALLLIITLPYTDFTPTSKHQRARLITNWKLFQELSSEELLQLSPPIDKNISNEEIDIFATLFSEVVADCRDRASATVNFRTFSPYFNLIIKTLIKIKHRWQRKLKKIYHRCLSRTSAEYAAVSSKIQFVNALIGEQIRKAKNENFKKFLEALPPSPQAFIKIYAFLSIKSNSFCSDIRAGQNLIYDKELIANEFLSHFNSVYQANTPQSRAASEISNQLDSNFAEISDVITDFNPVANAIGENRSSEHLITVDTAKASIIALKNKKSFGPDKVPNAILKNLLDCGIDYLTTLFNQCINNGYFPSIWKTAKIIPIKKRAQASTVTEYRPISLLSNVGKLFEKILIQSLDDQVNESIPTEQFGFKKEHSTCDALLKFTNDTIQNLRLKRCTVAISLDIEKAFDTVYHNGLLIKLFQLGVSPVLVKLLRSFLSNRKFFIDINGARSNLGLIHSGVPQGSILAPYLFNCFMYDFPHCSENSTSLLYADDALLYASNSSPVIATHFANVHLNKILDFYKKWGIKVNIGKTDLICIRNSYGNGPRYAPKEARNLSLKINNCTIKPAKTLRYLGVNFNHLFKFNNHVRVSIGKASARFRQMASFLQSSHLDKKLKLLLYKVSIKPIMTYAAPIWFTISPSVLYRAECLERKIIRHCIGKHFKRWNKRYSNNTIYSESKILPFGKYILELLHKFVYRANAHPNPIIKQIANSQINYTWANTRYISPLSILKEDIPSNKNEPNYLEHYFYKKRLPRIHRG